jgi:hypothetical protein
MQVFSLTLLRQSTTLIESSPIIAVGQHHKPAESLQGRHVTHWILLKGGIIFQNITVLSCLSPCHLESSDL